LDSWQGTSTFGAWLKKIVVNKSINIYNKNLKYQEVAYTDQLKYAEDDGIGIDREEEEQNPKVRKLLKAMDELKENYRITLTLHLVEGYDHEEICEILDISYASCRTTISRAKESLRKKIEAL
ncbi:MAG TPA: RNA polymerase sigma factor, partial [Salinimicrobium sp.]|nr:RNA polymerase sigma factor [Salinimicrobium sp.]